MKKYILLKPIIIVILVASTIPGIEAQSITWGSSCEENFEFPFRYFGEDDECYFLMSNLPDYDYSGRHLIALSKDNLDLKYKYLINKKNKSGITPTYQIEINDGEISNYYFKDKSFFRTKDKDTKQRLQKKGFDNVNVRRLAPSKTF